MTESPRPSFSLRDFLAQIRRRFPWPPIKPPIVIPQPVDRSGARLAAQIAVIQRAFEKKDEVIAIAGPDGRDPSTEGTTYLYRPGHVLVRDGEDFDILDRFFREPEREGDFQGVLERTEIPTMPGLVVARVPTRTDGADDVLKTLEEVDGANPERTERRDPIATPDHILYVTGEGRMCPASEPEEPPSNMPVPPVASNPNAGAGVQISVVDTGWWEKARKNITWLKGVTAASQADLEQVDPDKIHEYAGHGTFVAGVVRCLAPSADVEVEGFAPKDEGGAVWESQICKQLNEAIVDNDKPQIISVSAGTHTRNSFPLIGFELLALAKGLLDPTKKFLVVAAAGNDSSTTEFYPAAFDWVVGVGSVGANGKISEFSNTSDPKGEDWVNVYARGENLVNAFPVGTYTCYEPENIDKVAGPDIRHFRGMAQWSGTSFSTPTVSGAVAAQMTAMGTDNPRAAYDALIKAAPTSTDTKIGTFRIIGPL